MTEANPWRISSCVIKDIAPILASILEKIGWSGNRSRILTDYMIKLTPFRENRCEENASEPHAKAQRRKGYFRSKITLLCPLGAFACDLSFFRPFRASGDCAKRAV